MSLIGMWKMPTRYMDALNTDYINLDYNTS